MLTGLADPLGLSKGKKKKENKNKKTWSLPSGSVI